MLEGSLPNVVETPEFRDLLPKSKWIRCRTTHATIVGRAKNLVGMISTEHGKIFTAQAKRVLKKANEDY